MIRRLLCAIGLHAWGHSPDPVRYRQCHHCPRLQFIRFDVFDRPYWEDVE